MATLQIRKFKMARFDISTMFVLIFVFCLFAETGLFAQAQVRIKDISRISGTREYQILGYGLVTGLNGTGDKSPMSIEMVRGMLQNMGMDLPKADVQSKNCAAVMVSGMIPPYGKAGEAFDITVSSIGDSKTLQGGILLPALLKGGDGQVYAAAQGPVSVGGFQSGTAGGGTQVQNHLTVARIPKGAIQEREVGEKFGAEGTFSLLLAEKDFTLSRKVKEAVERKFGTGWAKVSEPGTVKISIPASFKDDAVSFASAIEDLSIAVEEPNRVVINERTGTVIVGNRVRISSVAISHGKLKINIGPKPVGPASLAGNEPPKGSLISIQGETTVEDLINSMNAIGATPKDLISIFQAISASGALHGELKIM